MRQHPAWLLVLLLVAAVPAHTYTACPGVGDVTEVGAVFRSQPANEPHYRDETECEWTIAPPAAEGECVALYFPHFHTEFEYDTVRFSLPDGDEMEISGRHDGIWYNATTASMVVHFSSDNSVPEGGFVAVVHVQPCRPREPTECTALHDFIGPEMSAALGFTRVDDCCPVGDELLQFGYDALSMEYVCWDGHIEELHLRGLHIDGNSTLDGLQHLRALYLFESPHTTTLPRLPPSVTGLHVELFPSLRTIDLSNLGEDFSSLFVGLSGLTELPKLPPSTEHLTFHNAGPLLVSDLSVYTHMRSVEVRTGVIAVEAWPPNVEQVTLLDVVVENGHLPPFPSTVTSIHFERCQVRTLPRAWPDNLHELVVIECDVETVAPLPPSLWKLALERHPRLTKFPSFVSTCGVSVVHLAHTSISDVSALQGCGNLGELDVSHTQVHTLPPLPESMFVLEMSHSKVRRVDKLPLVTKKLSLVGLETLPDVDLHRVQVLDVSGIPFPPHNFSLPEGAHFVRARGCGLKSIANAHIPRTMQLLDLSDNALTEIPPSLPYQTGVARLVLNVSHNQIRKLVGLSGYLEIHASHNLLTELGREGIDEPAGARVVDVSHNQISELVLREVSSVNASHNMIEFLSIDYPEVIDVSHNRLTSLDVCAFEFLDASHNRLTRLFECDSAAQDAVSASFLDLSHNQLESFDDVRMWLTRRPIAILNVAHNDLHGEITFPQTSQRLLDLDVSHNARLRGALPDVTTSLPALVTLNVLGTGMHDTAQEACWDDPQTCHFGGGLVLKEMAMTPDRTQECPVLLYAGRPSLLLSVDWRNYTDARMCRCLWGYTGSGGDCRVCPHGAMCEGARMQPVRGRYAHDACQSGADEVEHQVLTCPSTHAEICAPRSDITTFFEPDVYDDTDVPCAQGYEGRMCLSCARGWHSWGALCRECPHPAVLALVVCAFVIIVGIVVYSAYMCKESTTGSLKIMVFLAQMIQLLGSMGSSLDTGLLDAAQSFDSFMLRVPGIECYSPSVDFVTRTWGMMVLPFGLLAFCALVFAVGLWWNATRRTGRTARTWMRTNQRAFLFLLLLLYLPISTAIMSALPCERDACTGGTYFANAPSVRCSTHRARSLRIMAGVAVVWFVAGVPALFAAMAWRVRTASTHADESVNVLDFLTSSFTEHAWWWEAVATARKITIVAIVSFVPSRSIWVALSIVTVLFVSTVGQRAVLPFRERMENTMEYSSLGVSTVCFACSVAFHVPDVFIGPAASIVIAILLYTSFFCVAAVVIAPKRMAKLMHMANVPVHTDSAPLLGGHK